MTVDEAGSELCWPFDFECHKCIC